MKISGPDRDKVRGRIGPSIDFTKVYHDYLAHPVSIASFAYAKYGFAVENSEALQDFSRKTR